MKITIRRILLWMLVLSIAGVIYLFSCQSGDASHETSISFVEPVLVQLERLFGPMEPTGRQGLSDGIELVVRKAAHMLEFGALAVSILLLMRDYRMWKAEIWAWALTVLYAVTDELHQFLGKAGRSGQPVDVLVDASGGAIAIFLVWFVLRKRAKTDQERAS